MPTLPRGPRMTGQLADQIAVDPRFNTPLPEGKRASYDAWKAVNSPNDSGYDYDLQGAFLAGLTRDGPTGHFDDRFKKPNHPTFSDLSQYAPYYPTLAGHWKGDEFTLPNTPIPKPKPAIGAADDTLSGGSGPDDLAPGYMAHAQQRVADSALDEILSRVRTKQAGEAKPGEMAAPSKPGVPLPTKPVDPGIMAATGRAALDVGTGLTVDLPRAMAAGARDAVQETVDLVDGSLRWLEDKAGVHMPADATPHIPDPRALLGEPSSVTGGAIQKLTQFMTGWVTGARELKAGEWAVGKLVGKEIAPATSTAGKFAEASAKGAITGFQFFDGQEEKLGDTAKALGVPANVVPDFLSSAPGDNEAEGRLKNALGNVLSGAAVEGVAMIAKSLRAARAARQGATTGPTVPGALPPGTPQVATQDFAHLGDPEAPLVQRKPADMAQAAMAPTELGVPTEVGAKGVAGVANEAAPRPLPTAPTTAKPAAPPTPAALQEIAAKRGAQEMQHRLGAVDPTDLEPYTELGDAIKAAPADFAGVQAHGIAGADPEKQLAQLLTGGIDQQREWHTGDLGQAHDTTVRAAGLGAKIDSPYVLISRGDMKTDGIDAVVVNGAAKAGIDDLRKAFPNTQFLTPDQVSAWSKSPATAAARAPEPQQLFVNFARIDTPDDVKSVLDDMAQAMRPEIDQARGGAKTTFEQIKLSANQEDAFQALAQRREGNPLRASQAVAARQLWATSASKLTDVARVAAQNPSDANLFAFRKMLAVHHAIQSEVIAARTETARALASWRIPVGSDAMRAHEIENALAGMGGQAVTQDMAQRVAALSVADMPDKLDAFVTGSVYARTRNALMEAWINALLSGPKTHIVNMMSNTSVAFMQMYERKAAAGVARLVGDASGVQGGESMAQLFGLVQGGKDGLRYAWNALKTGEGGQALGPGKLDTPHVPAISSEGLGLANDSLVGRFADGLGTVVRAPGRALTAEDELFKSIGYRMELNSQALRQATQEANAGAIPGSQLNSRIADIIANPPDNVKLQAIGAARYATFTQAPGKLAQHLSLIASQYPAVRVLIPFIRTPANILKYTFERTPLAPLMSHVRADMAAGGARAQLATARMATGSMIGLTTMDLALSGRISGGGPVNPDAKAALLRSGWQPYSAKVGDRWYSYSRMDPLGMTLGQAADLVEILHNSDWHEDTARSSEAVAAAMAASIGNNVMNKTYMSGLSNFFDAMADPTRSAESFLQKLAGSAVPAGVAEVARQIDPNMREVNSMLDQMRSRTPGLSKGLPQRRDMWGRPMTYESGLGWGYDAMSPIYSRRDNPEPIDKEILKQGFSIQEPPRSQSFNGVTVNLGKYPSAWEYFKAQAGNDAKDALGKGALDTLNDYVTGRGPLAVVYRMRTDGPDGGKEALIRTKLSDFRSLARDRLLSVPLKGLPPKLQVELAAVRDEIADKKSRQSKFLMVPPQPALPTAPSPP